jgi:two-component sensor histidine kinase
VKPRRGAESVPAPEGPAAEPVLILAPFRRDAETLTRFLHALGVETVLSPGGDAASLTLALDRGIGLVVAAQEALTEEAVRALRRHLDEQPPWSSIPIIILLDARHAREDTAVAARELLPDRTAMLLQRPLRSAELASAVRSALASRRRQLQVRDHLALQRELMRELQHRVKNMLANVGAVYRLTAKHARGHEAFRRDFEGRLEALTRVHGALADPGTGPVGLREVVEVALSTLRLSRRDAMRVEGPPLRLRAPALAVLSLCVHELAANAVQHGALSVPEGRAELRWGLDFEGGERSLRLRWVEAGGPPVTQPEHRGYGYRFLISAVRSFRGRTEIEYASAGLRCTIVAPFSSVSEG